MEFPKTASELAIWLGVQFPVVAAAAFLIRWAVRYTERLHEKRIQDAKKYHSDMLAEKDVRLRERDERVKQLLDEVAELRAKLSRSKKSGGSSKADSEGD